MVELMSFTGYLNFKNSPFKLLDSWKKKLDVEDKRFVRCNILLKSDLCLSFLVNASFKAVVSFDDFHAKERQAIVGGCLRRELNVGVNFLKFTIHVSCYLFYFIFLLYGIKM